MTTPDAARAERREWTHPYTPAEVDAIVSGLVLSRARSNPAPYPWSEEGRVNALEKVARAYAALLRSPGADDRGAGIMYGPRIKEIGRLLESRGMRRTDSVLDDVLAMLRSPDTVGPPNFGAFGASVSSSKGPGWTASEPPDDSVQHAVAAEERLSGGSGGRLDDNEWGERTMDASEAEFLRGATADERRRFYEEKLLASEPPGGREPDARSSEVREFDECNDAKWEGMRQGEWTWQCQRGGNPTWSLTDAETEASEWRHEGYAARVVPLYRSPTIRYDSADSGKRLTGDEACEIREALQLAAELIGAIHEGRESALDSFATLDAIGDALRLIGRITPNGLDNADSGEPDAWLVDMLAIADAAWALVDKLHEIHASSAYRSVWTVAEMHGGPYRGPTYTAELTALHAALAGRSRAFVEERPIDPNTTQAAARAGFFRTPDSTPENPPADSESEDVRKARDEMAKKLAWIVEHQTPNCRCDVCGFQDVLTQGIAALDRITASLSEYRERAERAEADIADRQAEWLEIHRRLEDGGFRFDLGSGPYPSLVERVQMAIDGRPNAPPAESGARLAEREKAE
jgi:hypothetical protein